MDAAPPPSGRQLELTSGPARAVVVEVGGGLRSLTLDGRAVLTGYAEHERPVGGRGQHLLPWPNRVRDGRWSWRGQSQQLPLTEPAVGNASHGLGRWGGWEVTEAGTSSAVLRHVVHPQPGWPGRLEATCAWHLAADALTARVTVRSLAAEPLPLGYGAHPYLAPRTALVDDEVLHVPASRRLLTDERGLPVGEEEVDGSPYDFRTPRPVGDLALDTCYGGLDRRRDGSVAVRFGDVEVWGDEAFRWFQVYSGETLPEPERRRSLAVEPMTCPPDALNSGTDLVVLEPGDVWTGTWGIRTVGAATP
ncbi:MAG: aldose 1-epimerase family protein [Actinomycetota bacterium]|nr:aldose 1-epimerase family protein [Actinomycetota bacterium]